MPLDGTVGNDPMPGTAADEVLNGLAGNDTLDSSGGGIDTLFGGADADLIYVRTNYDAHGDAGNDTFSIVGDNPAVIDGGTDYDILRFEGGYDISNATITGVEQLNVYYGGALTTAQLGSFALISGYAPNYTNGSVVLTAGGTATVTLDASLTSYFQVTGSTEAENLTFNATYLGQIITYMGAGNDRVSAGAGNDSLRGETGNDTLIGNDGNDSMDGGAGPDTMNGGNGNDFFVTGAGDSVQGGSGDDLIGIYESGATTISGSGGIDTLRFENSYDISGTALAGDIETLALYGNDSLTAAQLATFTSVTGYNSGYTTGQFTLTQGGTATVNLAASLTGPVTAYGSQQADLLTFTAGHLGQVVVYAGLGNDSITSSDGADSLRGDGGDDTLTGTLGNDTLDGSFGLDILYGGSNDDYLILHQNTQAYGGNDNDYFQVMEGGVTSVTGGGGTDTLRFNGSADISNTVLATLENLYLNGNDSMTAAQLGSFANVQGYADNYTTATVFLTQGGTATVKVSNFLTGGFYLYGSDQADIITVQSSFLYKFQADGGFGNDSLTGAAGGDSLFGNSGNDTLVGLAGADSLDGGAGLNSLSGGTDNDYLVGRTGDTLSGGDGDDLFSVQGDNIAEISGGAGNDTLRVENGQDLTGMVITGIERANLYGNVRMTLDQLGAVGTVGGYNDGYTTATVYLTAGGTATVTLATTLTVSFSLYGSSQADLVTFATTSTPIRVNAGGGNDSITAGNGNDSLYGDAGSDSLNGGSGNDYLDGSAGGGANVLYGGSGADSIVAHVGDTIGGGNDNDVIYVVDNGVASISGGSGTDTLRAENNVDLSTTLISSVEQLNIYSLVSLTTAQLAGFATVSGYESNYTSASLVLTQGGTATVTLSPTLTTGFTLYGSDQADLITFSAAGLTPLTVNSGAGDDSIAAGGGNDSLYGDLGNDTLTGQNGNDSFNGGSGSDSLVGGSGNDYFTLGAGDTASGGNDNDTFLVAGDTIKTITGGSGTDTLQAYGGYDLSGTSISTVETLWLSGTPIMTTTQLGAFGEINGYGGTGTTASVALSTGGTANVNLGNALSSTFTLYGSSSAETLVFNAGHAGGIYVTMGSGADNVTTSDGADTLYGVGGNDTLSGKNGIDQFYGGGGADVIIGGSAADTLYGGGGKDVFDFNAVNDSATATPDHIYDYEGAGSSQGDVIDLADIDADGGLGAQDSFVFGSAATAGVSLAEDGSGNTLVQMNTDADAAFEMVIIIHDGGTLATAYTASDFVL